MDTTEQLQAALIALMEDVLVDSGAMTKFRLELTITPIPVWRFTQSTTRYSRQAYYSRGELRSTLQSLRASNAPTSSNTPE